MKVLIIGGGASGLMAALSAAEDGANRVTLLERQGRVGRKLLATGNGRCNLTNLGADASHYHGAAPEFVKPALERFGVRRTLDYFRALGLLTVAEADGKVYPLSDQASSVLDVLRFAVELRGVTVVPSCDVIEVKKKARGYEAVSATGEKYFGDKLIVCCGGCAGKRLGGVKSGYFLLGQLGHSCTALYPCLTQIETDPTWVKALKGVRADCRVALRRGGRVIQETAGELQFTEFGVSGPVAFELSRAASTGGEGLTLVLDFFRDYPAEALAAFLRERRERFPQLPAEEMFSGSLQSRLGKTVLKRAGFAMAEPLGSVGDARIDDLCKLVKAFPLNVTGVKGFDNAQVTVGGVPAAEFRRDTLESRIAPGVFAAGEVLDIDGDCGGFNLQWAWSSGYVAGKLGKGGEDA